MGQPKRSEAFLRALLKHYGFFWHKYGDVRYCIHCHQALPKSENAPDFAAGMVYTYVECKNSNSTGTWIWTEIAPDGDRKNQRAWLLKYGGWLFIELGEGTAPKGKSAYLVPIDHWVERIEPLLISKGMKSVRKERFRDRPGADEYLATYRLIWKDGIWLVPDNHFWWTILHDKLKRCLLEVAGHIVEHSDPTQDSI